MSLTPWYRQLADRVRFAAPLKAVGTAAFMVVFFWAYFSVLRHPLFPPITMPLLTLDAWIPFTPLAFPAYAFLWVYASLPPALLSDIRTLLAFGAWIAVLCGCCLCIFWLFPTQIPPSGINWAHYPELSIIKNVDVGGNACPSLHVAAAVFSAFWLNRILAVVGSPAWLRAANVVACGLIVWSTLAIRQHVALDMLAGLMIGVFFALFSLRYAAGGLKVTDI